MRLSTSTYATILLLIIGTGCAAPPSVAPDEAGADAILSSLHQNASDANWDTYFGLFADDAVFMGTDATERWSIDQFKGYASASSGWTYEMTERHVYFSEDGQTAWFDELLENVNYGLTRGTGVLTFTDAGWKISQYNLTIPIPNDLARNVVAQIRAMDATE